MEFQKPLRGLASTPATGWPLDKLLVGPGTLGTLRQILSSGRCLPDALRGWDVSLWSGVTPQGSRHCMQRLREAGLLSPVQRRRGWHAETFRVIRDHPLVDPFVHLFAVERRIAGPMLGINDKGRINRALRQQEAENWRQLIRAAGRGATR